MVPEWLYEVKGSEHKVYTQSREQNVQGQGHLGQNLPVIPERGTHVPLQTSMYRMVITALRIHIIR